MNTGSVIRGALSYNEHKVRAGKADLLLASGFSCDIMDLNFSEKLRRFELLIQRNEKIETNTLHLSLNFSPKEVFTNESLQKIAVDYMERIGFAGQPFLVYRHNDTSHPHIHIVTTPIKANGRSIYMHNIAKRLSEPARKDIEIEYNLIRAEAQKRIVDLPMQPINLNPAIYGKEETKNAIGNIVKEVIATYKFTSLDEFNAILCQYNLTADRGRVGSNKYKNGGLTYSIINEDGYKIGKAIKASDFFFNATLVKLYEKFEKNKVIRTKIPTFEKDKISIALQQSKTANDFIQKLYKNQIQVFVSRNHNGIINEINFINNRTRTILTGAELGISLSKILDKFKTTEAANVLPKDKIIYARKIRGTRFKLLIPQKEFKIHFVDNIIKGLMSNEPGQGSLPELPKKRKKKKRKH